MLVLGPVVLDRLINKLVLFVGLDHSPTILTHTKDQRWDVKGFVAIYEFHSFVDGDKCSGATNSSAAMDHEGRILKDGHALIVV